MNSTFDERFILDSNTRSNIIQDEHLVRYELAKQLIKGKKVIDVACGTGYGSNMLAKAGAERVIGVDISKEAVKIAQKRFQCENLEYILGNAEKINQKDNSFDVVISFETIEHLKNPENFLSEIKRILNDNGFTIISTPNVEVSGNKNPYHLKEYTRKEFQELLGKYFKNVNILEQENAMISMIKFSDNVATKLLTAKTIQPLYFVAICSNDELPSLKENVLSVNYKALDNIYNNPGFKLMNVIYSFLIKIPGVKKLFGFIK
ncbi:class I SAM-dependent methyltransferase [Candidatus Parcubacteria bacterium]|nr:class I SAM-dependent methyltransferase [Candidatus Parcubacteria bacterium]